jgi:hypothetical protein
VPFPDKSPPCYWTGRNGTFKARALNLHKLPHSGTDGMIRVVPQGKRGAAKNAMIEFPVSIIPQVIEFLKEHQP